jgi:hypothetical protein
MALSTICHLHVYPDGQFYCWSKSEYTEKTTDLPQVTGKFYHIMLYEVHLRLAARDLTSLVVIGIDCESNYHTMMITTTTASVIKSKYVTIRPLHDSLCDNK